MPKNRFILISYGESGLNYLCTGYKLFLNHIRPYIQTVAMLLRQSRPASDIMKILSAHEEALHRGCAPQSMSDTGQHRSSVDFECILIP